MSGGSGERGGEMPCSGGLRAVAVSEIEEAFFSSELSCFSPTIDAQG